MRLRIMDQWSIQNFLAMIKRAMARKNGEGAYGSARKHRFFLIFSLVRFFCIKTKEMNLKTKFIIDTNQFENQNISTLIL